MQAHLTLRYDLALAGDEIEALGHIFQLARAQLAASPPQLLRGCPLERQAGLIGPQLYDVRRLLDRVVEDLELPDVSAPAAPAPLLLEAPVAEAAPAEPIEAPTPADTPWQWKPMPNETYWSASSVLGAIDCVWHGTEFDTRGLERGNTYRTEAEALDRSRLDDELALSAHLRQLGGGDNGRFAVRYNTDLRRWGVLHGGYDAFAPGEARFQSAAVAIAARDKLRAAGLLPRERLAPEAAEAPAEITGEVPHEAPALDSSLHHNIMVLLLTPPGWPAPAEVWEAIRAAAQGPQS